MGNGPAIYGYNPSQVDALIQKLQSSYNSTIYDLEKGVKSFFVDYMAVAWASPNAVKYFQQIFKTDMERAISTTTENFSKAINAICTSANIIAQSMGTTYPQKQLDTSSSSKTIDVSGIKEEINGKLIFDSEKTADAITRLQTKMTGTENNLKNLAGSLRDSEAFLNPETATLVQNYINQVTTTITGVINGAASQTVQTMDAEKQMSILAKRTSEGNLNA